MPYDTRTFTFYEHYYEIGGKTNLYNVHVFATEPVISVRNSIQPFPRPTIPQLNEIEISYSALWKNLSKNSRVEADAIRKYEKVWVETSAKAQKDLEKSSKVVILNFGSVESGGNFRAESGVQLICVIHRLR